MTISRSIEPTYPSEKYGYIIPIGKEQVSKVSIEVQLGEAIDVHDKQKFELEY